MTYIEHELEAVNEPVSLSIPYSTVDSLVKLFRANEDTEVKFYAIEGKIFFKLGNTLTISRVVDMNFPNYKAILETGDYDKKLTIVNNEFSMLLRRVLIFVRNNQESRYGATLDFNGDAMVIEGANDLARINETLKVNFEGEPIKIALNTKFILDFVQNLDKEDNIVMEMVSSAKSVRITGSHKYIYIVMPLSLKK